MEVNVYICVEWLFTGLGPKSAQSGPRLPAGPRLGSQVPAPTDLYLLANMIGKFDGL